MGSNSEINELIIQTVDDACEDKEIRNLVREALRYELDIWNRNVLPTEINDEYGHIVEKILKGEKE